MPDDDLTDLERAARAGDVGAFRELVRRLYPLLHAAVQVFGVAEQDAPQVVQEAWLRVLGHAAPSRAGVSLDALLLEAAHLQADAWLVAHHRYQPTDHASHLSHGDLGQLQIQQTAVTIPWQRETTEVVRSYDFVHDSLQEWVLGAGLSIEPARLRQSVFGCLRLVRGVRTGRSERDESGPLPQAAIALLEVEGLDLTPLGPADPDGLADAMALTAAILADALTVPQAAAHLHTTVADIGQRLEGRLLYGVWVDREVLLPSFQFTVTGLVPGIDVVLGALPADLHLVEVWGWLTETELDLDLRGQSLSPLEWLRSGGDPARAAELASGL